MAIRIVTDSTCDLPLSVIDDLGIVVIPLYINIGDQGFLDGNFPGGRSHQFMQSYQSL